MPELVALREAEEYAEKVVDQSRKDAQKTRLNISSRIEEMNGEKDRKLREVASQAENAVEEEMKVLEGKLTSETEGALKLLDERIPAVEEEARKLLAELILRGGERD